MWSFISRGLGPSHMILPAQLLVNFQESHWRFFSLYDFLLLKHIIISLWSIISRGVWLLPSPSNMILPVQLKPFKSPTGVSLVCVVSSSGTQYIFFLCGPSLVEGCGSSMTLTHDTPGSPTRKLSRVPL